MATLEDLRERVSNIILDSQFTDDMIDGYLNDGVLEIAGGLDSAFGDFITPPLPKLFTIGTIMTDDLHAAYSTFAAVKTSVSAGDSFIFVYNDVTMAITVTGDFTTLQTDVDTALVVGGAVAGDVAVSWSGEDLILTCAANAETDTIVGGAYNDVELVVTTLASDSPIEAARAYVSMPDTFQRDLVFVADSKAIEIDISNSWIEFMESNPLLSRTGTIYEVVEQAGNLYYQGIPTDPEVLTVHFYRFPVDMEADDDTPDGIPLHLQKQLLVNYVCKEIFALIEDGIEGQQVNTMKYLALFQKALRTLEMTIPADTRALQVGG